MVRPGDGHGAGAREGALAGAIGGAVLGLAAGVFLSLLTASLDESSSSSTAGLVALTLMLVLAGSVVGAVLVALLGVGVVEVGRQVEAGRIPRKLQRLGFALLMAVGGLFIGGAIFGRITTAYLGHDSQDTASVVAAVGGGVIALVVGVLAWRRSAAG
jgi:hypothetical protein